MFILIQLLWVRLVCGLAVGSVEYSLVWNILDWIAIFEGIDISLAVHLWRGHQIELVGA